MADGENITDGRLTSWKEIATYLQKGVRTVQRWEQELGLPVHRLEGHKRDIVFALPEELDVWLERHSHVRDENEVNGQSREEASSAWGIRLAYASLLLALLFGARQAYLGFTAIPVDYRIEGRDLIVLNESGRELWRHTFDFPLAERDYEWMRSAEERHPSRHFATLRDMDGDGRAEMLFGAVPAEGFLEDLELFCFNHKGSILWRFQPTRTIRYGDHHAPGDHHFEPPYSFGFFNIFSDGDAAPDAVWATFNRAPWFPSVVTKLSVDGELLGEYWHAGFVSTLAEATLAGKRVLLVGAVSNESISPALSVIDYENPTGFSPASDPAYLCQNCPGGLPLSYIRFPRTELSRVLGVYESARVIRLFGEKTIQVIGRANTVETTDLDLVAYYFDENLHILDASLGLGYTTLHNRLRTTGMLDHRLDMEKELADLGTPLTWNGESFVPVKGLPRP